MGNNINIMNKETSRKKDYGKIFSKIGIALLILYTILFAIETYMNIAWELEQKEYNLQQEELLQKALETGNTIYCDEYKIPSDCIYLVGKKYQNISVCDLDPDEAASAGCKAAILKNNTYCEDTLKGESVGFCKTIQSYLEYEYE